MSEELYTVEAAANSFFTLASASIGGGMLTVGNANLLMAHGTELQQKVFALNEFSGRWSGTMAASPADSITLEGGQAT